RKRKGAGDRIGVCRDRPFSVPIRGHAEGTDREVGGIKVLEVGIETVSRCDLGAAIVMDP
ncbi:MAG: hypothetical protein ACI4CE_00700, partial [Methanomethylophilus alvi]